MEAVSSTAAVQLAVAQTQHGSQRCDWAGQAVEALETVPVLAHAIERAGVEAPVTSALARLIEGTLPVDDWVALVRAKQPPPAGFARPSTWWSRCAPGRPEVRDATARLVEA